MAKTTTELAPVAAPPTPLSLIQSALAANVDPEKLGKLLDLQERYEKNQANAAYNAAMATCQAALPMVVKDKTNKFLQSKYASLETVLETCQPVYSSNGFSISFDEEESKAPGFMRLRCDVSHADGATRSFFGEYPIDGTGAQGGKSGMNPLQARGSTTSYARRYLLCRVFNIAIADEDKDGNAEGDVLNAAQVQEVFDAIEACDRAGRTVNMPGFLKWLQVDSIPQLPQRDLAKALTELKRKAEQAR